MQITKDRVVTMHYSVADTKDNTIDSSFDGEPLVFILGTGYLIPGLEAALEGKQKGDTMNVEVAAADAYGERDDNFIQTLPADMFAGIEDLDVGTQLRATTDEGEQSVFVIDIDEEENTVTVDGNHPLAGIDLKFDVEILDVREATADEIAHGHVHAEGGCNGHH